MYETSHDADLVARARRGEVEAFGQLYRRYFEPIFRYLRLRVEREADAEDLAETVFLRAFQSLPRYRERGWPFSAYLYRIARNALADHYRGRRGEADLDEADRLASPEGAPDEGLEREQTLTTMRRVLSTLPTDYQEVIRLRILLGLSTEATAEWMKRSEGAVRVLLFRALRSLRDRMGASGRD